ncbi:helix-turn-helix domain-containing protein [Streptomyces sp. TSRI0281]|uniref:helix-turn-helix domain-containing protein n=2 Tax=unclassified Streptomyces TaxID=2593676 RepID=UPI0009A0F813|nr:helix-turn-helix transcriptional regulator [Streptomyces sp. TSRI0281]
MDSPSDGGPEIISARFGALVTKLAIQAGYDLSARGGGRAALAQRIGMSPSAVGRMLTGETLPRPDQFESIAAAVDGDVTDLLIEGGVLSPNNSRNQGNSDVRSATNQSLSLSPEAAADRWGITDPMIRSMLISNIRQAIGLQQQADRAAASGGA